MSNTKKALGKALEEELGRVPDNSDKLEDSTSKNFKNNPGDDINVRPWEDKDNPEHKFAKKRFESLSTDLRERISKFNLNGSIEDVLQEIPVAYYDIFPDGKKDRRLRQSGDYNYNRTVVAQIVSIVSETGQYQPIWEDFKIIDKFNFLTWMRKFPEFMYLMLIAREHFRLYAWKVNPDIKKKAIKALEDGLSGNRKEVYKIVVQNPDGTKSVQVSERTMAPPKWIIEHVLGLTDEENEDKKGQQVTELTLE